MIFLKRFEIHRKSAKHLFVSPTAFVASKLKMKLHFVVTEFFLPKLKKLWGTGIPVQGEELHFLPFHPVPFISWVQIS